MLRWIQNELSKSQRFFLDIVFLVAGTHILLLIGAILYQIKPGLEQITLSAPDLRGSTLVFVPLHKKIEQPTKKSTSSSLQKPQHMMTYDEFTQRQKKAKSVLKKAPAKKKTVQKKSSGAQIKEKKQAELSVSKKQKAMKSAAATTFDNAVSVKTKKAEPAKAKVEKSSIEKIEMKAEKVIQEKIEEIQAEQEPMQEKQEEVSALKMPQEKTNDSAHELEELLEPIDLNDVTFVGIQDLQHLELQQLVATELAKHWKRPLGMDQKACIVKVEINKAGNVTTVVIEKSSGVPVFDLSAKAAALKASYPKEIWNKKLAIQF